MAGAAIVVVGLVVGGVAAWLTRGQWDAAAVDAPPVPGATETTADAAPVVATTPAPSSEPTATPTPTAVGIDLAQYSTTDPSSLWVVVNKQHPVDPLDYEPPDLVSVSGGLVRSVVAPDLAAMLAAAKADGVSIGVRTAYRSYNFQVSVHADVVHRSGTAYADKYSARPGYSEHQTGLALDIHSTADPSCDLKSCFTTTPEGQWVAAHGWEFGFVVRYTPENSAVTGYSPEAWHLRYVGRELAAWMHANGVASLEEVFGVSGGSDYPAD
ncbi:MAG TPA: D-alanyl-D-alanine carboxypeptidase family protein [Cellulomonas sp.]